MGEPVKIQEALRGTTKNLYQLEAMLNLAADVIDDQARRILELQTELDGLRAENEALKAKLERVEGLLSAAICPNIGCIGGSIPHQVGPNDWEAQQCQWCYEANELRAALGREGE